MSGRPRPLGATCKRGHPWVEENIRIRASGARECRVCARDRDRARDRRGRRQPGSRAYRTSGIQGLSLSEDRWRIRCRDGSLVRYYRAVVEADIGRHLTPEENVHHRNGDPTDDRLENLQVMTREEHRKLHARPDPLRFPCAQA